MVHASQRPVTGLRMGLGRCQSAGACLGGLACIQDRQEAAGQRRHFLSQKGLSKGGAREGHAPYTYTVFSRIRSAKTLSKSPVNKASAGTARCGAVSRKRTVTVSPGPRVRG